jgi:molybdopterin-guanine dinucleotide biosynthesis protein A
MKENKNITGIILAGGKSTRMGTDKGFISFKDKTFVEHIITAIQPLVGEIIIILFQLCTALQFGQNVCRHTKLAVTSS